VRPPLPKRQPLLRACCSGAFGVPAFVVVPAFVFGVVSARRSGCFCQALALQFSGAERRECQTSVSASRFKVVNLRLDCAWEGCVGGNVHGGAFVHGAAFVHARDLRCNHPPEDHNTTTTTAPNAIEN
jgi:hypothetical protein